MTQVFTQRRQKSLKGDIYAPGQHEDGSYCLFVLRSNYAGHVRGGVAKTWRAVAQRMTLDECKALFTKRLGWNPWEEHQ